MNESVLTSIYASIDEINALRGPADQVEKSLDTPLTGRDSRLDSLGLVNFIVALEQAVEDATGITVDLSDGRALAQQNSPFQTIGTLASYVEQLLTEKRNAGA
jgi:acyl carrier protein